MDKIKLLIALAGGAVSAYFKAYIPLIAIVAIAAVFDMITGIVAAICTGSGLNSKKAMRGAIKKATMFLALGFGTFLDYLIPLAAAKLGIDMGATIMFSGVIAFYIAFGECVSVCENLYRCNPNVLPGWVARILTDATDSLNKKGDK